MTVTEKYGNKITKIYIKELDGYLDKTEEERKELQLINKYEREVYNYLYKDDDSIKDIDLYNPDFPYVEYGGDLNIIYGLIDRLKAAGFTIEIVDI